MRHLLLILVVVLISLPAIAQYDDVYYDPGSFSRRTTTTTTTTTYENDYDAETYASNEDFVPYDDSNYDGEPFGYDDYSGYEYSSRIRRFRQPYAGFGYYDPVYVDQVYYPGNRGFGSTVLIYNSPYAYNSYRYNRFNRWNDPFYSYSSFNRFNRFNDPFYNPYAAGRFGASPFGYNSGFGAGYNAGFYNGATAVGGGYYCPPSWGNGATYNTPNAVTTANRRAGTNISGSRGNAPTPTGTSSRRYRDIQTRTAPSGTTNTRGTATPSRTRTPDANTRPSRATQRPERTTSPRPNRTAPQRTRTAPQRTRTAPSRTRTPRATTPRRSAPRASAPSRSPSRSSASPSRSSSSRSSGTSSRSSRSRRPN